MNGVSGSPDIPPPPFVGPVPSPGRHAADDTPHPATGSPDAPSAEVWAAVRAEVERARRVVEVAGDHPGLLRASDPILASHARRIVRLLTGEEET